MDNELIKKAAILPKRCRIIAEGFNDIQELTTTCGITVIDTVLSGVDADWFAKLKQEEKGINPDSNRIVNETRDKKFPNPFHMDFQAVMKMFIYRKEKVMPVCEAFQDVTLTESKHDSPFLLTVDHLIDIRNDIIGHLNGAQIKHKNGAELDSEEEQRLIFKYREGVLECISFLSYFKTVLDDDGVSFYEKAKARRRELEKKYNVVQYPIDVAIKNERLKISVMRFAEICADVYINTYTENGVSYFFTDDYNHAIQVIKVVSSYKKAPEQRKNRFILVLIAALVLAVAVIWSLLKREPTPTPAPPSQAGQTGQAAQNDTVGSIQSSTVTQSSPASSQESAVQSAPSASSAPSSTPQASIPKISGSVNEDGLTFSINQSLSNTFKISYDNQSGKAYSLGWVQSAAVVIETDLNTYYCNVQGSSNTNKIAVGGKGRFTIVAEDDIEGTIKSITVENVLPLTDVGLPEMSNTVGFIMEIPITYN